MSKSILWIVDGWRYWDTTNGNSYHLTRVTHTGTRKSEIFDECVGNITSVISKLEEDRTGSYYPSRYHVGTIEDIKCRQWRRMLASEYRSPVSQYHRSKRGKVTNITSKIINSLRRTS